MLYIDGARMGYGLMSEGNDVTLPFLAKNCDVFYIGGTKIGALCGEAVVFTHNNAHRHFFSIQKQHGAVIAKGRLIGAQFEALFTDNLYFEISKHAIDMAMKMRDMFKAKGYRFHLDSPSNQQFILMTRPQANELAKNVKFTFFGQTADGEVIARFVTSWSTTEKELQELERYI